MFIGENALLTISETYIRKKSKFFPKAVLMVKKSHKKFQENISKKHSYCRLNFLTSIKTYMSCVSFIDLYLDAYTILNRI